MKSLENAYKRRRNLRFIGRNGRNRPIDAFNPHQRSGLNAPIRNGKVKSWPLDHGWTLWIDPRDVRDKTHQMASVGSRSDDRDVFLRNESRPL